VLSTAEYGAITFHRNLGRCTALESFVSCFQHAYYASVLKTCFLIRLSITRQKFKKAKPANAGYRLPAAGSARFESLAGNKRIKNGPKC
jgi:hypothetical protein